MGEERVSVSQQLPDPGRKKLHMKQVEARPMCITGMAASALESLTTRSGQISGGGHHHTRQGSQTMEQLFVCSRLAGPLSFYLRQRSCSAGIVIVGFSFFSFNEFLKAMGMP